MSHEFTHDSQPTYKVTESQLDHAVETFGSYDEAYRHLGVTPDEVDFGHLPETETVAVELPPIAVNLGERALALADIMEYLNKANKTRGSATLMDNGGGEFRTRYGLAAPDVQHGAEINTTKLIDRFRRGVGVLAATDALRAHGYDEDDIELEYSRMQSDINRNFGVGNAYAKDRHVAVKKAARASAHLR
jgi:hypothetical protein